MVHEFAKSSIGDVVRWQLVPLAIPALKAEAGVEIEDHLYLEWQKKKYEGVAQQVANGLAN